MSPRTVTTYGVPLTEAEAAEIDQKRADEQRRTTRDPATLLPSIREQLGLDCKLLRVVMTDAESPTYRIETSEGVVRLGTRRWMDRQQEFRSAFIEGTLTGEAPAALGRDRWDVVRSMIRRAAEVEDVGEGATDAGLGAWWLREFLAQATVTPVEEFEPLMPGSAVRQGDTLHVLTPHLRSWLLLQQGERPSHARLGEILRSAGCEPGRLDLRRDGKRSQQRTWIVPDALVPDEL